MIIFHASGDIPEDVLVQLRLLAGRFPGDHVLRIEIGHTAGLTLGDRWLYDGSQACLAALGEFGKAQIVSCE